MICRSRIDSCHVYSYVFVFVEQQLISDQGKLKLEAAVRIKAFEAIGKENVFKQNIQI